MRRVLPMVLLVLLAAAPAVAQDPPLSLTASQTTGWVGATITGRPGESVSVAEAGGPATALTLDASGRAAVQRLVRWECARRMRTITVSGADGRSAAATIRTRACTDRLQVTRRTARPRAARPVALRLRDRFGTGGPVVKVCPQGPGRDPRCTRVTLRAGDTPFRFRPAKPGRWRVVVSAKHFRTQRVTVRVLPRSGALRILATGDSMIQIIDSFLKQRLETSKVKVRSEAKISTGISKPAMFNWMAAAERQASSYHPDATVVFLGANDGFPIGGRQCCGEAWVAGYAKRVRTMMRAYARNGSGTVLWLLLPTPRKANFAPIYRAVNQAVIRAARTQPDVTVVDLVKVFTPGGRFRAQMRVNGQTKTVRQPDGVHLNVAGASLAASVIIRTLRAQGVL